MFGSVIIDVAIGLVLVYLLLSLIASAAREGIESVMKSRAVQLERGIRTLLDDPNGTGISKRLYDHPIISGLFRGNYTSVERRRTGANLPTYIPTGHFVQAILDLAVRPQVPAPYVAQQTSTELTTETLRASISRIESPVVQRALRSALDTAQGDIDRVRKSLGAWFDGTMDRVSGWYKRETQWYLIVIGLVMAIGIDVDTVRIAQHLYRSPAQRAVAVAMAERVRAASSFGGGGADALVGGAALARLDSLQLPILWRGVRPMATAIGGHALDSLLGWIVTTLAVSLGAPFWFDMLNKIMVVRSTVKPREKSQEEASDDRQKPKAAPDATEIAAAVTAAAFAADKARAPATPTSPESKAERDPNFTPREWANAEEDGII